MPKGNDRTTAHNHTSENRASANNVTSSAQGRPAVPAIQLYDDDNSGLADLSYKSSNLSGRSISSNGNANPIQRKATIPAVPVSQDIDEEEVKSLNQSPEVTAIMNKWVGDSTPRSFRDQVDFIKEASQQVHTESFNGTLTSLASELSKLAGPGLLNDASLLDILKRGFEANWFKAKSVLAFNRWPGGITPPDHELSISLMEALVEMRSREWEKFYNKHLPLVKTALKDPTLEIPPPDGSQSVTSDIDLSVKGEQSEAALEYFNANFKADFGVPFEPGTMFDINLYSLDWMHGANDGIEVDDKGGRTGTITPAKEKNLEDVKLGEIAERTANQETWSYVKIMRNLSQEEIDSYKTQVLSAFKKGEPKYVAMAKKLDEADQNTRQFKEQVAMKSAEIEAKFDADMKAKGLGSADSEFKKGKGHDSEEHYAHEALTTTASNALYQEKVKEVKAIRLRIQKVKEGGSDAEMPAIENLATLLANKIAEALTYANEVYASEGGVLHTVYGKQKAAKKLAAYKSKDDTKDISAVKTKLTDKQYIQSVNENVGDSIHSLNHNSHMPQYAVFRAGKYLDRLCEAAELLGEEKAPSFTNYQTLKKIGVDSVAEKNGVLGKDPMAVVTHEKFSMYDAGKLGTLKQQILGFGAEVTSFYNQ